MVQIDDSEIQAVYEAIDYFLKQRENVKRHRPGSRVRNAHLILIRERLREAIDAQAKDAAQTKEATR